MLILTSRSCSSDDLTSGILFTILRGVINASAFGRELTKGLLQSVKDSKSQWKKERQLLLSTLYHTSEKQLDRDTILLCTVWYPVRSEHIMTRCCSALYHTGEKQIKPWHVISSWKWITLWRSNETLTRYCSALYYTLGKQSSHDRILLCTGISRWRSNQTMTRYCSALSHMLREAIKPWRGYCSEMFAHV